MGASEQGGNDSDRTESSIWTPLFFSIIALRLCISVISHSISSGNPLYIQSLGEPVYVGGLLVAAFTIATIVARVVSGALVDIYSRQSILIGGALLVLLGALLPLLIPSIAVHFAGCLLEGMGFALAHTAATTATADILPMKRLGEGIGYSALGQSLGMAIGPSIALWLTGFDFAEAMSLGVAFTAAVALVLGFIIRYERNPEKLPKTSGYRKVLEAKQAAESHRTSLSSTVTKVSHKIESSDSTDKKAEMLAASPDGHISESIMTDSISPQIGTVDAVNCNGKHAGAIQSARKKRNRFFEKQALRGALPMLLFALGLSVFFSYTALFGRTMGYENPTMFFIAAGATTVLVRLLFSRLFNADNPSTIFFLPVACGIAALTGMCLMPDDLVFCLLGIGYGIAIGMAVPILNSVAVKTSPPDKFGPANALFYLMYDVGVAAGALLWGFLFDFAGFIPLFIGGAFCLLASYALAFAVFPRAAQ